MDDIPLPEDIPIPRDGESDTIDIPADEVCNIQLPDDVAIKTNDCETIMTTDTTREESVATNGDQMLSDKHVMLNRSMDVPLPAESERDFHSRSKEAGGVVHVVVSNSKNEFYSGATSTSANEESKLPSAKKENESKEEMIPANSDSSALANSQLSYPTTGYMQYDPSMMSHSHNYSYMTANNYAPHDYVSLYHTSQRMAAPSYATAAYNPYQSYNHYPYTTATMQQMYDGRNMAPYTASSNYTPQMLPQNPPLPPDHPIASNNFQPPLPVDYTVQSYTAADSSSALKKNDKEFLVESTASEVADTTSENDSSVPQHDAFEVREDADEISTQSSHTANPMSDKCLDSADKAPPQISRNSTNYSAHPEDVNRYSPSLPMEEDETSHQVENIEHSVQNRPSKVSSVLGKAQAKKRLMAFSISKQAAAAQIAAKKAQASSNSSQGGSGKERKDNCDTDGKPNSTEEAHPAPESTEFSGGIFDDKQSKKKTSKKVAKMEKARETIEEIEEIKRTEMMIRDNSMLYRQALINDSDNADHKSDRRRNKGSRRRSRSYSRSRSRRRTRSRSRERNTKREKKYRRKSRSRTRSKSRSHSRSGSPQRDKKTKVRASNLKDWHDFKEAGFQLDRYRRIKFKENKDFLMSEVEKRKREELKRSRSNRSRSVERRSISIEKEVVEANRKRKLNLFDQPMEIKQPLLCSKDKNSTDDATEFPSYMMQYTNTRPILKYCENTKFSELHLVSRAQLLDTVPDDIALLLRRFWCSLRPKRLKTSKNSEETNETSNFKNPEWWPKHALYEIGQQLTYESVEEEDETYVATELDASRKEDVSSASCKTSVDGEILSAANNEQHDTQPKIKSTSMPRKSRFEDLNEEVKPELSVVVRSKWDSDYEDSPRGCSTTTMTTTTTTTTTSTTIEKNETDDAAGATVYCPSAHGPPDSPHKTHEPSSSNVRRSEKDNSINEKQTPAEKRSSSRRRSSNEEKSSKRDKGEKPRHDDTTGKSKRKSKSNVVGETRLENVEEYELSSRSNLSRLDDRSPREKSNKITCAVPDNGSGDGKLVTEYEEFLKMVSFEVPRDNAVPLYEGPKPPPQLNDKSHDEQLSSRYAKRKSSATNRSYGEDDCDVEKPKVKADDLVVGDENDEHEEEFDVDKFFLEEKEKKMKQLTSASSAILATVDTLNENNASNKRKRDENGSVAEPSSDNDANAKVKRHKKEKRTKKKLSVAVSKTKNNAKNKKKRKTSAKKGKISRTSSDSSSDSSDSETENDTFSSENSVSSSTSSSSSSSSSSSENDSSPENINRKKHKRTKRLKKKVKKKERKSADKRKKRKRKRKDSDSDHKRSKRKKSKSDDVKKKKTKKLPAGNILELLAERLKKTETVKEENVTPSTATATASTIAPKRRPSKEKRKKSKKKSDKERKDKTARDLLQLLAPTENKQPLKSSAGEDGAELSESVKSDKSAGETKKKKKTAKKRRETNDSSDNAVATKKEKKMQDSSETTNVVKAKITNSFFEENLDDWNEAATVSSVVQHSMRDDAKASADHDRHRSQHHGDNVDEGKKRRKKGSEAANEKDRHKNEDKDKKNENENEKRAFKKKKKDAKKKKTKSNRRDADADATADAKDAKLPLRDQWDRNTPERNFAMFASRSKNADTASELNVTSDDGRDERLPEKREFNFDFLQASRPADKYDYLSRSCVDSDDSLPACSISNASLSVAEQTQPERYTPTECDIEDESVVSDADVSKNRSLSVSALDASKDSVSFAPSLVGSSITNATCTTTATNSNMLPYLVSPLVDASFTSDILTNTMPSPSPSPSPVPVPVPLPVPVPVPVPVPPPSQNLKSNLFSFNNGASLTTPTKLESSEATHSTSELDCTLSSQVLKNFGKFVASETVPATAAITPRPSFTGKLEVRTKAAKKFVHSNIFDSFDMVEEHANLEAPCKNIALRGDDSTPKKNVSPLSGRSGSATDADPATDVTSTTATATAAKAPAATATATAIATDSKVRLVADYDDNDFEKEEFQARRCIALPDISLPNDVDTDVATVQVIDSEKVEQRLSRKKDVEDNRGDHDQRPLDFKAESRSTERSPDRSSDRLSKRYGRRSNDSRDESRRRSRSRTRSRSHSHSPSRSHDHRKKHHQRKDGRRKRSMERKKRGSRSHSRSPSRGRKRSSKDGRSRRRDFRSTSRDRRYDGKRGGGGFEPSAKYSKNRKTVSPTPDENSTVFQHVLDNMKMERVENRSDALERCPLQSRRAAGEYELAKEFEKFIGHVDLRNQQSAKTSTESSDPRIRFRNPDMNALREKLYQLKESLSTLNEKGVPMDALENMLSVLANSDVCSTKEREDVTERKSASDMSPRSAARAKEAANNGSSKLRRIMDLCQVIQNSLPSSPEVNGDRDGDHSAATRTAAGPTTGSGSNGGSATGRSIKAKKSLADSTNTYFRSKNRFEERSREISPKPLSLDERLELELGVKNNATSNAAMSMPPPPPSANYYGVPMYDNMANYAVIPPHLAHAYPHLMPPPLGAAAPLGLADRNYYGAPPPPLSHHPQQMNWNNAETFMAHANLSSVPPSSSRMVLPTPHQLPPQHVMQPTNDPQAYRIADAAGSKVHSIQVGNVLQIVPTELQMVSPTSQPVSSHQSKKSSMQNISPNVAVSSSSQLANDCGSSTSAGVNSGSAASTTSGFSSILNANLPVSFAAAPAVAGSKTHNSSGKELKHAANESKQKSKEPPPPPPPPLPSVTSPNAFGCSKITNLPLPPGTPDTEMKKLYRLAKEKRKEEKVLQKLLKMKGGLLKSPATPNSDENYYGEEHTDGTEESNTGICIKPSPEQGILISPGFKDKSTPVTPLGRTIIGSARKMVSFVDGIRPGSASLNDSPASKTRKPSPPPNMKKKHKVRVKIIRTRESDDDDDDDDDTPPPPPPGPPPPELYPPTCPINLLPSNFTLPKI